VKFGTTFAAAAPSVTDKSTRERQPLVPVSSVVAFWAVAAALIMVPGPDWAFAISAGLRRQVLPAAGGIMLGYLAMTVVVAAGLGLLITTTPATLTALTAVGGTYLVWLGINAVRHTTTRGGAVDELRAATRSTLLRGMAVSGLNPKGLLIFVTLLPQFSHPHAAWPVPAQLATLGLAFTLTCGVVYLAVGAAARTLLRARPAAARVVSRISGSSMIVLGIVLLIEHLAT
jgi:threonine/homoserine/homoserine lactone efflux protein